MLTVKMLYNSERWMDKNLLMLLVTFQSSHVHARGGNKILAFYPIRLSCYIVTDCDCFSMVLCLNCLLAALLRFYSVIAVTVRLLKMKGSVLFPNGLAHMP